MKEAKMFKTCSFCGNKNFKAKSVQYIYKNKDNFLIVNNVPCEECEYCGEQYYQAEVLKKIENEFLEIHSSGKKTPKQLTVPVEEFVEI